jgi:hypothetical protein
MVESEELNEEVTSQF